MLTLTGATTGTTTRVPITVEATPDPVASTTTATANPGVVKVRKDTTDIEAVSVPAVGVQPTGEVVVLDGTTELGRSILTAGRATVTVGPFAQAGTEDPHRAVSR